jgi:hypothetical protein
MYLILTTLTMCLYAAILIFNIYGITQSVNLLIQHDFKYICCMVGPEALIAPLVTMIINIVIIFFLIKLRKKQDWLKVIILLVILLIFLSLFVVN